MNGDDAREAQDRFAEPAQPEEQQERAHDPFQQMLGDDRDERDAQCPDDDREGHRRSDRSEERRAPTARDPDRKNDRGCFDELHRARHEGGRRMDGEGDWIHTGIIGQKTAMILGRNVDSARRRLVCRR
jgi:hypothetical protein